MKIKRSLLYCLGSFILFSLLWGCALHTVKVQEGKTLLLSGNYDEAVEFFETVLKKYPKNVEVQSLLYRARLSSYYYHLAKARKYRNAGQKKMATIEYKKALDIFPLNKTLEEEFEKFVNDRGVKKKTIESVITPPVKLEINTIEKVSLNLKSGTPITKIFKMLGKSYGVNFIFDRDFRDFVYSIEVEDVRFYDLLNQLCLVANAKYRVVDPSSILIYQNSTFKRRTLDLRGVKLYYLSNINAEDAKRLITTVFRDKQIVALEDNNINAVIVKGSIDALKEVERFLVNIDKEKSEVGLDVEILEVNRNLMNKIGADFGTVLSTVTAGARGEDGKIDGIINVNNLDNTNFFITMPTVALNLLASNDKNKIIAKPNLRGVDGEEIHFMVGDEIPVPQTQFAQIAAGGVGTIPQTSYGWKKVGVDIKLTPTVHRNNEVTIKIKLTYDFVTQFVDNVFPVLGKRELENVIRLKEGETSIIGGFIRDEVRDTLSGIPGLSKLPILGRLFGNTDEKIQQTDVIFSITPRVIRKTDISDENLETIWSDTPQGGQGTAPMTRQTPVPRSRDPRIRQVRPNSVMISPPNRRVPANTTSYFTLRLNASTEITSLSISGSISGGQSSIDDVKTDFYSSEKVSVLKNYSQGSFDMGFTFKDGGTKSGILAQLKVKFNAKGKYTISLDSIGAYDKDRKRVEINASSAMVEVY